MISKHWLILVVAVVSVACQSSNSVSCDLNNGTTLAATTWPKFRADTTNSGRAPVDLNASTGNGTQVFDGHCNVSTQQTCTVADDTRPCPGLELCMPIGSVSATPILGPDGIFVASSDSNVYLVDYHGQPMTLSTQIQVLGPIVGSPLLGADGVLFVPGNSQLTQFFGDGAIKNSATLAGFASASPNIWEGDGTTFVGTQSGGFDGVCPNGVARFSVNFPATQSSAALVQDPNTTKTTPIIIGGGANGQVRAYTLRGRQSWSFFASANIVASVLIDQTTNLFYVADTSGHVFAANVANGRPDPNFLFSSAPVGISASPALSRDAFTGGPGTTLYIADQSGILYALDRATGAVLWTFQADGPITSSPAVATGGSNDVIVFAVDILGIADPTKGPVPISGKVYAVRDDGDQGSELWTFDTGHAIGASSPAIGADGTVYIGRQGARLGTPSECPNVDRDSDGQQDDCVINDGGALYAIAP